MDLVFGGGKYGVEAIEYLLSRNRSFIVVDVDTKCLAVKNYSLQRVPIRDVEKLKLRRGEVEGYFVEGGIFEALKIIEELKPEHVFPTAPIHLSAALIQEKFKLNPWFEGIDSVLPGLPAKVIVSVGRGSIVVTYNRDYECQPNCSAPDRCPVTGILKPAPMYRMLEFAAPKGFILQSHQLKPGIGALKGNELELLIKWAYGKNELIVGTACRCHGVITALRK
ncbi:MAG: hypothetical protein H0Z28_01005 [Archaeoglobus sp.]|nr:hypothetical protein [Archaeoglobus sp.]